MHASVDLFLAALVFGLGFHIAGGVITWIAGIIGASRPRN